MDTRAPGICQAPLAITEMRGPRPSNMVSEMVRQVAPHSGSNGGGGAADMTGIMPGPAGGGEGPPDRPGRHLGVQNVPPTSLISNTSRASGGIDGGLPAVP